MKAYIDIDRARRAVNLAAPIDISIPLRQGADNVNAFFIDPPRFEPFCAGSFVGSVAQGGACNCENLTINAHGNGTHTECIGHITRERITINSRLKQFVYVADLITVQPTEQSDGDRVITAEGLKRLIPGNPVPALIIRTLPNTDAKLSMHYSGTNPAYTAPGAMRLLREAGVKHLLLDLPSVDREEDDGRLLAHHAFWHYPEAPRMDCTITEMVYVPDSVPDGRYLLTLQIMSIESDASPSKPVLYELE